MLFDFLICKEFLFVIFACHLHQGILYVALEFVPGDNLRNYLRKNRPIQLQREQSKYKASPVTMTQLMKFGEDVAKGMQHLSDAGVSCVFTLYPNPLYISCY